jgi:cation transport ATPase
MKTNKQQFSHKNYAFAFVAIASILLISIPAVAMQFSDEVNWGIEDFSVMFLLLFGTGSAFVLASRHLNSRRNRVLALSAIGILSLFIWGELSVGVFTRLGS